MMIKCGIDMVLDSRIQKNADNAAFLSKVYHQSETGGNDIRKLSSIFALKESVFKALDIPPGNWLEIEVSYGSTGKPRVILSDQIKPANLISLDCSVTHEGGFTQAQVVVLLDEEQ